VTSKEIRTADPHPRQRISAQFLSLTVRVRPLISLKFVLGVWMETRRRALHPAES
jgi:hypothetical protein